MPATKSDAQRLLRGFRITGLKVDAIAEDRLFCLTGKMLHADNTMRRRACTVIFMTSRDDEGREQVEAIGPLKGWVVDDNTDPWLSLR